MIGIASELIGVHPQTLRMYEQKGLLRPRKSIKNTRLYSQEDIELGRYIQRLTQEMGMNLAGVKRILDLERRIARLEAEKRELREEDRKSTRLNSSHANISYAVFCLKKKTTVLSLYETTV